MPTDAPEVGKDRAVFFGLYYDGFLHRYVVEQTTHTVVAIVASAREADDLVKHLRSRGVTT